MGLDKLRLLEVVIAIIGGSVTIYGVVAPLERILVLSFGILMLLLAIVIYLGAEIAKSNEAVKDLKKRLDYKEELHKLDMRMAALELKMNKKGKENWVTIMGVILFLILLYVVSVLIFGKAPVLT
jgi:Mn2+/Fe2+ NRAMP family transporter